MLYSKKALLTLPSFVDLLAYPLINAIQIIMISNSLVLVRAI